MTDALAQFENTIWKGGGMIEDPRRRLIGSILLTAVLGLFAMAILGVGAGLVSAGLIFIALVVALNL
jgi:hypothetical protein